MLRADGLISAMKEDTAKVRYPKKVRALAKLEAQAIEIGVYECNIIAGLLQTPEHTRTVIEARQPPYSPDDLERMVAARLARQAVFERDPAPSIHFVLEEAPLHRWRGVPTANSTGDRPPAQNSFASSSCNMAPSTLTSTAWTGFVHQPLPHTHPQKV